MTAAITVSDLNHRFGTREVLQEVTFQVPRGSFFIIIGPNGSGKTTLLKLMAAILPLQAGNISICEGPLGGYRRRQLAQKLAYMPQTTDKDPGFTVREIVLMGRAPHMGLLTFESQGDQSLAQEAMHFTGVTHLADRKLQQLSGGERQRVILARAICQQPKILLLDEPTAALDLAHQIRIMDLMERLKTEHNTTIVMVSHDLNLAAMYADQVMLVADGRVAHLGTSAQVMTYDHLEAVYGCPLLVDESPMGGYPQVHLVPQRYLKGKS